MQLMVHHLFLYLWFSWLDARKVLTCCSDPSAPHEGEVLMDHKPAVIGIMQMENLRLLQLWEADSD